MGFFFFAGVCTWACFCLSSSRVVVDFLEPRKKGKTRKSANAAITKGPNSPSPRFIFEIVTRNGYTGKIHTPSFFSTQNERMKESEKKTQKKIK